MSGIRIQKLPNGCTKKDIRIHFTKPDKGGGTIFAIFSPVLEGVAVVLFEEDSTAETVVAHRHELKGEEVIVKKLPMPVFEIIEARLTPPVAAFLQATEEIRDEIEFHANVEFLRDKGIIVGVRGNWYLLEWFWARVGQCMKRQDNDLSNNPNRIPLSQDWRVQDKSVLIRQSGTSKVQNLMRQVNTSDYKTDQNAGLWQTKPNSPGEIPIDQKFSFHSKSATEQSFDIARHMVTTNPMNTALRAKTGSFKKGATEHLQWRQPKSPVWVQNEDAISEDETSDFEGSDEESLNGFKRPTRPKRIEDIADLRISDTEVESETKNKIQLQNGNPDDPRTLDFKFGPLSVSVYTGMIAMTDTDAIVNASGSPSHAGGVAHAVAEAADQVMQRQCDEYVTKHGLVTTTEVMHTCAGGRINSKVKYIIHAVGPVWTAFEDSCRKDLTLTFLNCLKYGNNILKIRSLSLPVISSGIFGCPLEVSVRCFFNAVLLFVSDHVRGTPTLQEVHLVNRDSDDMVSTALKLRGLMVQNMERLLAKARREVAGNSTERLFGSPTAPTHCDTAYTSRRAGSSSPPSRMYLDLEGETGDTRRFTPERYDYDLEKGSCEDYRSSRNSLTKSSNTSPTSRTGYGEHHASRNPLTRVTNVQDIPGSTSRSSGPPTIGLQSLHGGWNSALPGLRSPHSPSLFNPSKPRTTGRPQHPHLFRK